jgi:hypothetical protein
MLLAFVVTRVWAFGQSRGHVHIAPRNHCSVVPGVVFSFLIEMSERRPMRLHPHLLILVCLGLNVAADRLVAATNLPPLDMAVARLLGTSRQEEIMLNRIVPWAGAHLGGVHIDTNRVPNRFYILDSANNRILRLLRV